MQLKWSQIARTLRLKKTKNKTDRERNPRKRRKELEEGEEAISERERVKEGAEEAPETQP